MLRIASRLSLAVALIAGCSPPAAPTTVTPPSTVTVAEAPNPTADAIRPFDEHADAAAELALAMTLARETDKLVLINFGANWCPDCRAFEAACQGPEIRPLIDAHFVVAKVDVGDWHKNPELVDAWDNPIEGGIPAVVIATPDQEILFTTKAGQLSKARHMGHDGLKAFFERIAALGG